MRRRPTNKKGFLSFEEAKAFLKPLNIKNSIAYKAWAYSMKRPTNIPVSPRLVFSEEWISWQDYLGHEKKHVVGKRRPSKDVIFMSYDQAKAYISKFNLKTVNAFKLWASSDKRPQSFPSNPDLFYKTEWKGFPEFLNVKKPTFLPYPEAKAIVESLNLTKEAEYRKWAASKLRPDTIPSNPDKYYKEDWQGWKVFLNKTITK